MDEYVAWFIGDETYIKKNDEPFIAFDVKIKAEDALNIAALLNAAQHSVQRTCAKRDEPDPLGMDIDEPWTESP